MGTQVSVQKGDAMAKIPEIAAMDPESRREVEEFRRAAREYTEDATASREAARAELVRLGIYTASGELSDNYK